MNSLTCLINAQQSRDMGCIWMMHAWLDLYETAKRREALLGMSRS